MLNERRLFGTNGIRGRVNIELTVEKAARIGCAIATFFGQGGIIVGHDARTSGPMLTNAVIAGLTAAGCEVFLGGLAPTPALQYATNKHKMDGGVIVTASHNPPEYNGIKVVWKDGVELSREQEIEIENIFFEGKIRYARWNNVKKVSSLEGIIDEYLEAIKKHVNVERIRKRHYRVVVDAANSVGALAAPYLLRDLGCKVITVNGDIDGTFPGRPPEPKPENLRELASAVRSVGADLGVAFDGDADRSIFVDEYGKVHWGDKTFALVAQRLLEISRGEKIVTPISSSALIKEIVHSYGGELILTKVGSVTVSHTMKKLRAKLGGEENGGIFYGPHQPVRDGAMATALILDIMAEKGEKLSNMLGQLPKYFIEKGKVECPENLKTKTLEKLIEEAKGFNISTIDGIKIWFEDESAILIRPSGTEPLYRLYAEAKKRRRAIQLLNEYSSKLKKIISSLKNKTFSSDIRNFI